MMVILQQLSSMSDCCVWRRRRKQFLSFKDLQQESSHHLRGWSSPPPRSVPFKNLSCFVGALCTRIRWGSFLTSWLWSCHAMPFASHETPGEIEKISMSTLSSLLSSGAVYVCINTLWVRMEEKRKPHIVYTFTEWLTAPNNGVEDFLSWQTSHKRNYIRCGNTDKGTIFIHHIVTMGKRRAEIKQTRTWICNIPPSSSSRSRMHSTLISPRTSFLLANNGNFISPPTR